MSRQIILFYSTNQAMWAADVLKESDIKHKMIPVPRELSSDCGYCVEFFDKSKEHIDDLLINNNVEFDTIIKL